MHPDHPTASPPPDPNGPPAAAPEGRASLSLWRTPLSAGVIGVSVVVYVASHFLRLFDPSLLALAGDPVQEGEWWRVFTTVFQHGSVPHILMNMFAVYSVGRMYEFQLGVSRFAQISLVTTLSAAAAVLWLSPWTITLMTGEEVEVATVGASGMILGWIGMVLPITKGTHREELISLIGLNALISFIPGVSWQGHLGGFLGGLACGVVLRFRGKAGFRYAAPILTFVCAVLILVAVRTHP